MPWTTKTAAAIALASIALVMYVTLAGPSGSAVAFAQVAEKLRAAQTLSFDMAITFGPDGKSVAKSRTYFMVPGKSRHEMQSEQEAGYVIMDFPAGKVSMVSTTQKTVMVSPLKGAGQMDMARREIDHLRSLQGKDARPLGERQIDGVRAKGFEMVSDQSTTIVWANAMTGEPIRIEMTWKNAPGGPATEVITNIRLDDKLDPALFSLDPPAGYKVMPFLPVDLNASPATYVAGLLKIYAEHFDGSFPDELPGAVKTLAAKIGKPAPDSPAAEELQKIAFYGGGVGAVTMLGKAGEQWQYYPGIKLGEKDRMVFWCYLKKTKTYSAVYGDLRVETINKDQLPPAPGGAN